MTTSNRSRRVAMFAYDCTPGAGSDAGLGWFWAVNVVRDHQVDLYTRTVNRAAIEAVDLPESLEVRFVDACDSVGPFRAGRPIFDVASAFFWLRRAVDAAADAHSRTPYDLAHYTSFSAYWMPTPLWRLGVPIVFGPLTGAEATHPAFLDTQSLRASLNQRARWTLFALLTRTRDWRRTMRHPDAVAVAWTERVEQALRDAGAGRVVPAGQLVPVDEGQILDLVALGDSIERGNGSDPHFVMSGRLLPFKGHRWAIEALAVVRQRYPTARLSILSRDHEFGRLPALAEDHGVGDAVSFVTELDRVAERRALAAATAMLLPSERDGGSTLLYVAMALGTPIVAFDVGAIRQITDGAALLVEPGDDPASALAAGVLELLDRPELGPDLTRRGRELVTGDLVSIASRCRGRWYETALADR